MFAAGPQFAAKTGVSAQFVVAGRPMRGWVLVEPEGIETAEQLRDWVGRSVRFVAGLPGK